MDLHVRTGLLFGQRGLFCSGLSLGLAWVTHWVWQRVWLGVFSFHPRPCSPHACLHRICAPVRQLLSPVRSTCPGWHVCPVLSPGITVQGLPMPHPWRWHPTGTAEPAGADHPGYSHQATDGIAA